MEEQFEKIVRISLDKCLVDKRNTNTKYLVHSKYKILLVFKHTQLSDLWIIYGSAPKCCHEAQWLPPPGDLETLQHPAAPSHPASHRRLYSCMALLNLSQLGRGLQNGLPQKLRALHHRDDPLVFFKQWIWLVVYSV